MTEITIEEPHGYMRDADGNVVVRFANYDAGTHQVPDAVDSVDYVDGPTAHTEDIDAQYKD